MSDEIRFKFPEHPTSWQDIDGWFDFEDLYYEAVSKAPPGAILVEVGTWLGRSAAYLCSEIRQQRRASSFFCVDTWKGTQTGSDAETHQQTLSKMGGDMFEAFHQNMTHWRGLYIPLRMTSRQASELFPERSIHFIFLDANHTTECVLEDIDCWRPKVISGGVMAGHDYTWGSVKAAVDLRFPDCGVSKSSWYVQL
jgi:cephalosporin hydroxylase